MIDPVIFTLGPLQVRWYGLMYVIAFLVGTEIAKYLARRGFFKVPVEKVDTMVGYLIVSMFLGARLTYVFVYNWGYYSNNIMELFSVWKGGLSFHGALAGMALGAYIFSKRNGVSVLQTFDTFTLCGPQGLLWGRIGNFINGELYGRVTDSPLGVVFPTGGPYARHPSQLYEAFFEGLVMMIVVWAVKQKTKTQGVISATFIMGYAFFRYFIEFFREADSQLGYYFGGTTTMGQILCFLMFLVGLGMFFYVKKLNISIDQVPTEASAKS